jgi:hypothetical protein
MLVLLTPKLKSVKRKKSFQWYDAHIEPACNIYVRRIADTSRWDTCSSLSNFLPNYKKAKHNHLQTFLARGIQFKSCNTMLTDQQEILLRTNRLPSSIRHGTHTKRSVQQFCYFYLCLWCRVNVSTEPFPSNDNGYTYTDWRQGSMPLR